MNKNTLVKLIFASLLLPLSSFAAGGGNSQGFSLLNVRVGSLNFFQKDGNCFTGSLDILPTYGFSSTMAARLYAGGAIIKTKAAEKKPFFEYGGLFAYQFSSDASLEAGVGLSTFIDNGGSRLTFPVNYVHHGSPLFNLFYVGYAAVLVPTNLTHEIRLGVGFGF